MSSVQLCLNMRGHVHKLILAYVVHFIAISSAQGLEWRNIIQVVVFAPDGTVSISDWRTLYAPQGIMEAFICVELERNLRLTVEEPLLLEPGQETYTQRCADGRGTEIVVRNDRPVVEGRYYFSYSISDSVQAFADTLYWRWQLLEPDHYPVEDYQISVIMPDPTDFYLALHRDPVNPQKPSGWTLVEGVEHRIVLGRVDPGEGLEVRLLMGPTPFTLRGSEAKAAELVVEAGPAPWPLNPNVQLPAGTVVMPFEQVARIGQFDEHAELLNALYPQGFPPFIAAEFMDMFAQGEFLRGVEQAFVAAGYTEVDRGKIVEQLGHIRFDHPVWDHYVRVYFPDPQPESEFVMIVLFPDY